MRSRGRLGIRDLSVLVALACLLVVEIFVVPFVNGLTKIHKSCLLLRLDVLGGECCTADGVGAGVEA